MLTSFLIRLYSSFQIQLHRLLCLPWTGQFFIYLSLHLDSRLISPSLRRLEDQNFLRILSILGEIQMFVLSGEVLNLFGWNLADLLSNFCRRESMQRSQFRAQHPGFIYSIIKIDYMHELHLCVIYSRAMGEGKGGRVEQNRVSEDHWEFLNSQSLISQLSLKARCLATSLRMYSSLVASRKVMQSCFSMMSRRGGGLSLASTSVQLISLKKSCSLISSSVILFSGSFSSSLRRRSRKGRLMYPILELILSFMRFISIEFLQSSIGNSQFLSSPSNGFSRNISSNMRTPRDQMSAFCPNSPESASGAMYQRVPTKVSIDFLSSTITLERPQSVSLICPSSVTSKFSGFSSRQTSPQLCSMPMPTTISAMMPLMMISVKGISFFFKQKQRSPMGRYSMIMQMRVWFWKVSRMLVKNYCLPMRLMSSHWRTLNSLILDFSMIFMAYNLPVSFYSVRTTQPKAPFPKYFLL